MTFKKLKRGIMVGVLALCASLSATSAYSQETFTFSRLSVAETLENDKDNRYSIFLEAARVAGLYEFLADDSQVLSIFPPINSAFEALPQDTLDDLLANPDALRQVLLYHVVRERLSDATVCRIARENGGSYAIQTLTGEDMILSCTDDNVILVNGIATARPELRVNSNRALIHPTLGILFPPASGKPPVAQPDSFGPLTAGTQGLLQVLGNDSDSDGNLDPATVMIISQPSHGTAVPQPDGTVLYTHNGVPGTGSDSFTYTVKDTDGLESNVVLVTISPIQDVVANMPPQAADDTFGPIDQGASTGPVNVLANDSDSDGTIAPETLTIVRQPANGTASVVNGTIVYIHNGRGSTSDSLVYVVADDDGASSNEATLTFTINAPANVPPVANDDTFGPVDQGSSTPLNVAANDSDSDGVVEPGTIVILSAPQNGTATVQNGQIVYVNDGSGAPNDTLTYTIKDNDGAPSNEAVVVISLNAPANQPPVASNDVFGPVDQGSTTPLNVAGNDSDPDGVVVPGTIVIVSQPSKGSATVQDGQIVYVNDGSGATSDTLTYTIKDDDGATSNVATVVITLKEPANQPPVAANDAFGPLEQGASGSLDVASNDSDVDGQVVPGTIVIVNQPANGTASVVNGQIVYVNDGSGALTDTLVYTIQDNDGATSNTATVTVTLAAPANVPPVAQDDTFGPVEQGSTTPLTVLNNDSDPDGTVLPGTIVITSQPSNGTATVQNGNIVYVNDGSGALSDSLTYTVQDDDGATSNEATVVISLGAPLNMPPVAVDETVGPLNTGGSTVINVVGNDFDDDGDVVPGTVSITSQPANGTAVVQGDGTVVYTNNGQPGAGSDSFTYTVQDDDGAVSNVATVTISPIEDSVLPNIVDLLIEKGNYTTLVELLEITGLADTLRNVEDVFTVFAPADDVFALLGDDVIQNLRVNVESTRQLLLYHVLGGQSQDLASLCAGGGREIVTAQGQTVAINCTASEAFVNASEIVSPDNFASNGVVHGIAPVLSLPDVAPQKNLFEVVRDDGEFNTLTQLLISTGLDVVLADLGNEYTLFAPTDAAFAKLDQAILDELAAHPDQLLAVLQYHVIAGQTLDASILLGRNGETEATVNGESVSFSVSDALFVDESRVVRTDIFATNGVAHAIDTVLIPDNVNLGGNTLWTIVENDSRFTKLKKLLELTGLDAEFKNSTAYTGFLPTNEAFHRLNSDGNKWWYYMAFTKQDVHYATKLLKMHVAAGTFDRASLLRSGSVTNLKGVRMDVKETQNCKTVDTHSWKWTWFKWNWVKTGTRQECGDTLTYVYKTYNQIIQSDITAKNGIAHVINYPLIPR